MAKGKMPKKSEVGGAQELKVVLESAQKLRIPYVDYNMGGTAEQRNREAARNMQETEAQVADSTIRSMQTSYNQGIAWEHEPSTPITAYKPKANPEEKKRRKAQHAALTAPVYAPTTSSSTTGLTAPLQYLSTVVPTNDLLQHQPDAHRSHPAPSSTVSSLPIANGPANGLPVANAAPFTVPDVGLRRQQSTATASAKKRVRQDDPADNAGAGAGRPSKGARHHTPASTPASSQTPAYALTGKLSIYVDDNGLQVLSSPSARILGVIVNDSAHTWLKCEGELLSGSYMLEHVAQMSTQPVALPVDYVVMYHGPNGLQPMLLRNVSVCVGVVMGERTHLVKAEVATFREKMDAIEDCRRKVEAIKDICAGHLSAGPPTGDLPTVDSSVSTLAIGFRMSPQETCLPSPSATTAASPAEEEVTAAISDDLTHAPSGTTPPPLQVVSPTPSSESESVPTQAPADMAPHLPEGTQTLYGLNLTEEGVTDVLTQFCALMEAVNKSAEA